MGFWEVVGLIVGGLVALNSAIEAVRGVTLAPVRLWRWLRRAVQAVDVVASVPARLDENVRLQKETRELVDEHIRLSKPQVALLEQMASDLGVVVHEVKHNGGSSMKDDLKVVKDTVLEQHAHVTSKLTPPRTAKRGNA